MKNGAGRVGDMLDDLTQARGAVGVAGPAAMDADRQDPAAGLVGFAEHVIDGGAAIIGRATWITVARRDQIAAVVEGLRIGNDENARAGVVDEIGQVVVARVGMIEEAALAHEQVTCVDARERAAVPA